MHAPRRAVLGLLSLALIIASCVGEAPTGLGLGGPVLLPINAALVPTEADGTAAPINRIRAVAVRALDGVVLAEAVLDVDPNAMSWDVEIEIDPPASPTDIDVFLRLIHVSEAGTEEVQFTGMAQVTLEPGVEPAAPEVDMVRGPLENLYATGVSITSAPLIMLEGRSVDVMAEATTSASQAPTVYWVSGDPTILSIEDSTVTALAPGAADLIASAGPFSDTVLVEVFPAPATVTIDPPAVTVVGIGATRMFMASVLDARGDTLFAEAVSWDTPTPDILSADGQGGFTAIGIGAGIVRATSDSDAGVVGTAAFTVEGIPGDLALTKTVTPTTADEGDTIQYQMVVFNGGDAAVPGLTVTDTLPHLVQFVGAVPTSGTIDTINARWVLDTLQAGQADTLWLDALIDAGAAGMTLVNTAELTIPPGFTDPDLQNNQASATVVIGGATQTADLVIQKTASVDSAAVGDTVDFQVVISNLGPAVATNVVVFDSASAALIYVNHTVTAGVVDTFEGTWALDTLEVGISDTLDFQVFVEAGSEGTTQFNIAEALAIPGLTDPTPSNNFSIANVGITGVSSGTADVTVGLGTSNQTPAPGDTLDLMVVIANLGPGIATNILVENSLSPELIRLDAQVTHGVFDGETEEWAIDTLLVDEIAELSVTVEVPSGSAGQSFTGASTITQLDQSDPVPDNDTFQATIDVLAPPVDIEVMKTVDEPQPLEGSTVDFTVSVINHGPGTATDVVVVDTLPAAFLTPVFTPSVGTVTNDTLWTIPTLAEGDTAVLTTQATVATGVAPGSATNQAFLGALTQVDSNPANDTSTITLTFPVTTPPTVVITAPTDGNVFDPGDTVTFAATATDPEDGDLTQAIVWTSSRADTIGTGGGPFDLDNLPTGVHEIVAAATDATNGTGADTVRITIALLTAPLTLNVPYGGTASLPITLSEPAPPEGFTVDVASDDESIVLPGTATVDIIGGALSVNATLQGLLPGTANVTVSNPQFGSVSTAVSVTAGFNVVQTTQQVPETFPQEIEVRLQSAGQDIPAPVGGFELDLAPRDATCAAVTSPITIPSGLVSQTATLSYGGSAQLPCSTYVVATAPGVAPDSVRADVIATPNITTSSGIRVGSGLQYGTYYATLGTSQHGGVDVVIRSTDPGVLLVSPNNSTAGTDSIVVSLANGQQSAAYWVHGVEGVVDDTVQVTITAPGFNDGGTDVRVIQPAFDLIGVNTTSMTTFSPEDAILVRVGIPNDTQTAMSIEQAVRVGADTLIATFSSDSIAVAEVITLPDSASPVTARIEPRQARTPSSVAGGGAAVDPIAAGVTTIRASLSDVNYVALVDSAVVPITAPNITTSSGIRVGSGLQYGTYYATLGASQHGGVEVVIRSTDPGVLLVSPNNSTAGTDSIVVSLANGQQSAAYWVHGVEGVVDDTVQVTITAPGFNDGGTDVRVIQPAFDLIGVNTTSMTTFSPEDAILVRVGIPNDTQTAMSIEQAVRVGADTLIATFSSDSIAVAEVITLPDSASPVTARIEPRQARTPSSVAGGGAAVDPIAAGVTTIRASLSDVNYVALVDSAVVPITAPNITTSSGIRVGSGLQYGTYYATLGASQHGGVDVVIRSPEPGVVLVSPNNATAGADSIMVSLANGQQSVPFWVHGVEGVVEDTVQLTSSAPGFNDGSTSVVVREPAFDLIGVNTTTMTTLTPEDPIQVRVGMPNDARTAMWIEQAIRTGADTLVATLSSSSVAVAELRTLTDNASPVDVPVAPRTARTGSNVANGGTAVVPQGNGVTTIRASVSDAAFVALLDSAVVPISAPTISMSSNLRVGSGLQYGTYYASLGASQHGGVDVVIRTSNPGVLLVSPNNSTVGTDSIVVTLLDGQTSVPFWIHGVEGATGDVSLTTTASGFIDGTTTASVEQPAIDIIGLGTQASVAGADDPFQVRVGIPNVGNASMSIEQAVRTGGQTISTTVTTSDPAIGTLTDSTTSGLSSVTLDLAPGVARSPTSVAGGGVAFDPVAEGATSIAVTATPTIRLPNATISVTVGP